MSANSPASRYHYFAGMNRLLSLFYESILHDTPVPIPYPEILRVSTHHGRDFRAGLSEGLGVKLLVTGAEVSWEQRSSSACSPTGTPTFVVICAGRTGISKLDEISDDFRKPALNIASET